MCDIAIIYLHTVLLKHNRPVAQLDVALATIEYKYLVRRDRV